MLPILRCFFLGLGVLTSAVCAVTLTVCPSGCDFPTIQSAVDAAEDGDTIVILAGTYFESVRIDKSLSLIGESVDTTSIHADGAPSTLEIESENDVFLSALLVTGASAQGLLNSGTTTFADCLIVNNGQRGIFNSAVSTVHGVDSTLSGHSGSPRGGAIYNTASANALFERCAIFDNSADLGGAGFNEFGGRITIIDSWIHSNHAIQSGGGFYTGCDTTLSIQNSRIEGNTAGIDGGAAACIADPFLTLVDTQFVDNRAQRFGGAVFAESSVTFERCRLSSNEALVGGAFYASSIKLPPRFEFNDCIVNSNRARLSGGGAFLQMTDTDGILDLSRTTFHDNEAIQGNGGAIALVNSMAGRFVNSTLTSNSAGSRGGSLYLTTQAKPRTLDIEHCTISHSFAPQGGGLFVKSGLVSLKHSIVANNLFGGDCAGPVFSLGYNWISDASCPLDAVGDRVGEDPELGLLQDLGGPSPVRPLLPHSPAIDLIPRVRCDINEDQRGRNRPAGARCDCGAYERQSGRPSTERRWQR